LSKYQQAVSLTEIDIVQDKTGFRLSKAVAIGQEKSDAEAGAIKFAMPAKKAQNHHH